MKTSNTPSSIIKTLERATTNREISFHKIQVHFFHLSAKVPKVAFYVFSCRNKPHGHHPQLEGCPYSFITTEILKTDDLKLYFPCPSTWPEFFFIFCIPRRSRTATQESHL